MTDTRETMASGYLLEGELAEVDPGRGLIVRYVEDRQVAKLSRTRVRGYE